MEFKCALTILLFLAIGVNSKKLPLGQYRPYIMRFNLDLREDKIVDFVAESLFQTNNWISSERPLCEISLFDVLSIIPFKKTSAATLSAAIDKLGIQIGDDELNNFIKNLDYTQLSYMGLNVGSAYKNFVKTYLSTQPTRVMDILDILGVGPEFAVGYAFGSDIEMFRALQNANFSLSALQEIESIINVKLTLKDLMKIIGLKKIDSFYLQHFVNVHLANYLAEKELQLPNFVNFLNSFMLVADDYKDMKSFKICYRQFSQSVHLGVAVSDYEIITNDDNLYQTHEALKEFTTFTMTAVQSKISYLPSQIHAPSAESNEGSPFFTFEVAFPLLQYIEKVTSYEAIGTKMCTYVTLGGKKLIEQPTSAYMAENKLKITKTFLTSFAKGSPLICDGILYGLAATEDLFTITFDTFEEETKPNIENIIDNPVFMQAMSDLLTEFGINPCDYFSCSPSTTADDFVAVPPVVVDPVVGDEESAEENESVENQYEYYETWETSLGVSEEETGDDEESVDIPLPVVGAGAPEEEQTVEENEDAIVKEGVGVEEKSVVEGQVAVEEQAVASNHIIGEEQIVAGNQIVVDEQAGTGDQVIVEEQVNAGDQAVVQEQAGDGQVVIEEQVVADDHVAVEEQPIADDGVVVQEQEVADGHVITEQLDSEVVVKEQAVADGQADVEEQAVADDQAIVEEKVAINDQIIVGEQVAADNQATVEEQEVVDDKVVAEGENVADDQVVAGEEVIADNQIVVEEQAIADDQVVDEGEHVNENQAAIEDQAVVADQLVSNGQAVEQSVADDQAVAMDSNSNGEPVIAEEQVVVEDQPVVEETAAAENPIVIENQVEELSTGEQVIADEQEAVEGKAADGVQAEAEQVVKDGVKESEVIQASEVKEQPIAENQV